jgi:hypothetical protein
VPRTTTVPGLTHTSTASTPAPVRPKLSPKSHHELSKKVKEELSKLGLGKVTPSASSR